MTTLRTAAYRKLHLGGYRRPLGRPNKMSGKERGDLILQWTSIPPGRGGGLVMQTTFRGTDIVQTTYVPPPTQPHKIRNH